MMLGKNDKPAVKEWNHFLTLYTKLNSKWTPAPLPQDRHLVFLHFYFLEVVLILVCCTMSRTSIHTSSGTLSIKSSPLNLSLGIRTLKRMALLDSLAALGPTVLGWQDRFGCVLTWRLEINRTTLKGLLLVNCRFQSLSHWWVMALSMMLSLHISICSDELSINLSL